MLFNNEVFRKNMNILSQINPPMYSLLEKVKEVDHSEIRTISNDITLKVKDKKDDMIFLSSYVDPIQEAKNILTVQNVDFAKTVYVVIGFGLGHHVRKIFEKKEERASIVIIEPRVDILLHALKLNDYSDIFSDGRVFLLDSNDLFDNQIFSVFLSQITKLNKVQVVEMPIYKRLITQPIHEIREKIVKQIRFTLKMIGNSPFDTIIGIGNTLKNIKYLSESKDLKELENEFKDIPALIISSGPSLDKNIDQIKQLEGKVIIIAAESIHEKLRNHGIVPDFVSVLERGENVYEDFFHNREFDEKTILLGQTVIEKSIFETYPGKKIAVTKSNTFWGRELSKAMEMDNSADAGTSVAHMNLMFADKMGCDPIIFVGQDLAYSEEGSTHAGETVYEGLDYETDHYKDTLFVKGNYEDQVMTNEIWNMFIDWFNNKILKLDKTIVNATEGGAYIQNTEVISLKKAIEKYSLLEFSHNVTDMISNPSAEGNKKRLKCFVDHFNGIKSDVQDAIDSITIGIDHCEEIQENDNQDELMYLFNEVNERRVSIDEKSQLIAFITQFHRTANFYKDEAYGTINTVDKLREWAEDQKQSFKVLLLISQLVEELLSEGIIKAKKLMFGETYELNFDELVEKYKKVGEKWHEEKNNQSN